MDHQVDPLGFFYKKALTKKTVTARKLKKKHDAHKPIKNGN
jgi:hypothetical protein